jgi:hypothetical protein
MMRRFLKFITLLTLLVAAGAQGLYLFGKWAQVPRQNLAYWRIEYASLDLESNRQHILNLQVRVESPPNFKKNTIPHLEVLLTDIGGQTVGYRDFSPQEWIPDELVLKRDWLDHGIPSQTEITVDIPLRVPEQASGFQAHLIYR